MGWMKFVMAGGGGNVWWRLNDQRGMAYLLTVPVPASVDRHPR